MEAREHCYCNVSQQCLGIAKGTVQRITFWGTRGEDAVLSKKGVMLLLMTVIRDQGRCLAQQLRCCLRCL